MVARYGTRAEVLTGRDEPWAEDDDFTHQGDSYTVRITALYPYKDYEQGRDELRCHMDFINNTTQASGRFTDIQCDARNPNENSGHLRRHSAYRTLRRLLNTQTPDPSPVFP